MPAFRHGRSAAVLVNTYDLSPFFRNGTVSRTMEPADVTVYGSSSRAFIAGLLNATISLDGYFSAASTSEVDAVLAAALQASPSTLITYGPEGLSIGRNVVVCQALESSYEISIPVGDVVTVAAEFQSDRGAWSARSLHALTAETGSTSSPSVDDGALTTMGGVALLHVTANTMDAATTIKVQHSADNSVFVDLVAFTAVGAATTTAERLTVPSGTTINRYLRCASTMSGTGSITFAVAFGRGNVA